MAVRIAGELLPERQSKERIGGRERTSCSSSAAMMGRAVLMGYVRSYVGVYAGFWSPREGGCEREARGQASRRSRFCVRGGCSSGGRGGCRRRVTVDGVEVTSSSSSWG